MDATKPGAAERVGNTGVPPGVLSDYKRADTKVFGGNDAARRTTGGTVRPCDTHRLHFWSPDLFPTGKK